MEDIGIKEMMEMQRVQHEKQGWGEFTPQNGRSTLLWMAGEVGEVIAVLKKKTSEEILLDPEVRASFVEEMADVAMYFTDLLLDYGVTAEEFGEAYRQKYKTNLERDFAKERAAFLKK